MKSYTATTSNATNTVTATPEDAKAEIEIKNGTTSVPNGSSASWSSGANMLTVKVTNGTEQEVYTVTVTKTGV